MAQYFLQPHAHVCWVDEQAILLDLQADTYFGFGPRDTNSLVDYIAGWRPVSAPVVAGGASQSEESGNATTLLEQLLARGIIIADEAKGKVAESPSVEPAARSEEPAPEFSATFLHSVTFARVWFMARVEFRRTPLKRTIERIQRRKALALEQRRQTSSQLHTLVASFFSLRPLFYTAKDVCLFDSVVLLDFFAAYNIFPTWVLGVQGTPFAAHSWVQHDDLVLNDSPEHVLHYKAILAV